VLRAVPRWWSRRVCWHCSIAGFALDFNSSFGVEFSACMKRIARNVPGIIITRCCSIVLPRQIGPSGAFRGPGKCLRHMKTQHIEAPAPAVHRSGRALEPPCVVFHTYEAPPGAPRRPRRARFKAEALLSNIAHVRGRLGHETGPESISERVNPTNMSCRASPMPLEGARGPARTRKIMIFRPPGGQQKHDFPATGNPEILDFPAAGRPGKA
jgi:hypothetical protein